MSVTDPVISGFKGWQRKKPNVCVTEGKTESERDEIPVFLVSLAVVSVVLIIDSKHSLLAGLLLAAEPKSTTAFGLPMMRAFWDALECLHSAVLLWQPASRSLLPLLLVKSVGTRNWAPVNSACSFFLPTSAGCLSACMHSHRHTHAHKLLCELKTRERVVSSNHFSSSLSPQKKERESLLKYRYDSFLPKDNSKADLILFLGGDRSWN